MKKKICLLGAAFLLAVCIAPIQRAFAEDDEARTPKIFLRVNGWENARISNGERLDFTATVTDTNFSPTEFVTWTWDLGDGVRTQNTNINESGIAVFTLNYDDVAAITPDKNYIMTASYAKNNTSIERRVRFGIRSSELAVIFTEPNFEEAVSINDPIHFKVEKFPGVNSTETTVEWSCSDSGAISAGYACPAKNIVEADMAYGRAGVYKITVTIKDNDGRRGEDEIEIRVVNDPPSIKATADRSSNKYEPGSTAKVKISSKDKFGTINQLKWGCSDNDAINFSSEYVFSPAMIRTDREVDLVLPNHEVDNYRCMFSAFDDDGEENSAILVFKVAKTPTGPSDDTKTSDDKKEDKDDKDEVASEKKVVVKEKIAAVASPNTGVMTEAGSGVEGGRMTVATVLGVLVLSGMILVRKRQ